MASTATALRVNDVSRRQASALKRKAERLGLSAGDYVKQLIEDDLALDRKAENTPLHELAAPFRKALKNVNDEEIDVMVERARTRKPAFRKR